MSQQKRGNTTKNTSSGQGMAGMGGQPSDDPRDEHSGGGQRVDEDRDTRTPPVPGAFGAGQKEKKEGGTPEL